MLKPLHLHPAAVLVLAGELQPASLSSRRIDLLVVLGRASKFDCCGPCRSGNRKSLSACRWPSLRCAERFWLLTIVSPSMRNYMRTLPTASGCSSGTTTPGCSPRPGTSGSSSAQGVLWPAQRLAVPEHLPGRPPPLRRGDGPFQRVEPLRFVGSGRGRGRGHPPPDQRRDLA